MIVILAAGPVSLINAYMSVCIITMRQEAFLLFLVYQLPWKMTKKLC